MWYKDKIENYLSVIKSLKGFELVINIWGWEFKGNHTSKNGGWLIEIKPVLIE